jgi:predicted Zn-dependent protease
VATKQKQELVGLVAFFPFGGKTYEVLGYTTAPRLDRYDDVFRATLASFDRVTDPRLLDVTSDKLAIVRIPAAMTLREFDERYPSAIDLDTLALINGVKADASLSAGTQVKRVAKGRHPPQSSTDTPSPRN